MKFKFEINSLEEFIKFCVFIRQLSDEEVGKQIASLEEGRQILENAVNNAKEKKDVK